MSVAKVALQEGQGNILASIGISGDDDIDIYLRSQMDVPGMVMTSSSEPVLKSVGGRRVVNEPQKLHRKIKENRITAEYLREHCRRHDLYMTPRFNTVLYLHHKVHLSPRKSSQQTVIYRVSKILRTWKNTRV